MKHTERILILGGGIIGLAIALELRLRGATVTVLSRDFAEAATQAAAGMLAPQAELLPPGALQTLALRSRAMYADWVSKLEQITGLPTGYWPCGILSPQYELPTAEVVELISASGTAHWLDRTAIQQQQPGLGVEVIGGWWFPEDAQVDNRYLAQALRTAAIAIGVDVQEGVTVQQIHTQQNAVTHIETTARDWQAAHYILATGAWSQELVPVSVFPRKGQMFSVRVNSPALPLQTVLFGSNSYIVPRQDGRIVIGATSEDVGFTPHMTPAGLQALVNNAIRLYPALQNYPIQELWWGFRPATPDESPILGTSAYGNLTLATGHYRNGILLAPVTAEVIANLVWHGQVDALLPHFHWTRFPL